MHFLTLFYPFDFENINNFSRFSVRIILIPISESRTTIRKEITKDGEKIMCLKNLNLIELENKEKIDGRLNINSLMFPKHTTVC